MEYKIHNCIISKMNTIYILLGANLGEPLKQIKSACILLNEKIGRVIDSSSCYESEAWGVEDQPIFYNKVLCIETLLEAVECLHICQEIELKLGRVRDKKWGARVIDIDILYYNDAIIATESLIVPHPYLHLRNFTLFPLAEIAPDYIHPEFNRSNIQLMLDSEDKLLATKMTIMTNFKIINPTIIRESMMNNESMITEFVNLYLEQCPIDFEVLTNSIIEQNPKAIGSAAHHIKPTMEYIGATSLRINFQELENMGNQEANMDDIITKYNEIKISFEAMLHELKNFNI